MYAFYTFSGNDGQRIRMDYQINSQLQYSRYYLENYDRQENSSTYKEWSYVYTPSGLTAVHYNNNGTSQLLYVNTDHLGSPITLTDPSGAVLEEYSFDAWGRRRNPVDWNDYSNNITSQYLIRGYTGHEHLDEVGIINMNGRIYDPVLARFLQPDNFVQAPDNLQNFNRYGYVYNNPLKYTDPSGELFVVDDLIFGLVGGVINVVTNLGSIQSFGQGAAFFGVGFVGGALATYITPVGSAALVGAGNAALGGYYKDGTVDMMSVAHGAVMGAGSAVMTMGMGSILAPLTSRITSHITNKVVSRAIEGGISGALAGGVGGAAMAASLGGDMGQAALSGAGWGLGMGAFAGMYQGYKEQGGWRPKTIPDRLSPKSSTLPSNERTLEIDDHQFGQKFGEHKNDYNLPATAEGRAAYREIILETHKSPTFKYEFPTGTNHYKGETWYIKDGTLLRTHNGKFRSAYPIRP